MAEEIWLRIGPTLEIEIILETLLAEKADNGYPEIKQHLCPVL